MSLSIHPGSPPELVVHDGLSPCPYLPGQVARLPLRLPTRDLTHEEFEERLRAGDRRQGVLLYRPQCPSCRACEAIRLDVEQFRARRTHRRILERGRRALSIGWGRPEADERRVELYNLHKQHRGLDADQEPISLEHYEEFLGKSCCDSHELRLHQGQRLVGVAIVDRASDSLSAVYCYYDPECERYSLGTLAILLELEQCRRWGLRHLYLGLYVGGCEAMEYKARFLPHERLVQGRWQAFTQHAPPTSERLAVGVRLHPKG